MLGSFLFGITLEPKEKSEATGIAQSKSIKTTEVICEIEYVVDEKYLSKGLLNH